MSACALAFAFTTGRWMSAIRAVNTAERAGGCLTVRQWFEVFNEDNLTNPIVPCPSGQVPSARGRWRTRLIGRLGGPLGSHTVRPGKHFHSDCYSPIVHVMFFHNVLFDSAVVETPPAKDFRLTAVGIERMETGDFLVNLALQSWQLDAGSLWELLNLSTDKGIMVTVRLASSRDGKHRLGSSRFERTSRHVRASDAVSSEKKHVPLTRYQKEEQKCTSQENNTDAVRVLSVMVFRFLFATFQF